MKLKVTTAVLVGLLTVRAVTPAYADTIELLPGQTVTAHVDAVGDQAAYTISATAGHTAQIAVTNSQWTTCGQLLFQDVGSDTAEVVLSLDDPTGSAVVPLNSTGDAQLIVRGCEDATGSADLSWLDVPAPTLAAVTPPHILGTATVGQVLTVTAPVWSADGVDTTYEWSAAGHPVATGDELSVTEGLVGQIVTLSATGTKAGFTSATVAADNSLLAVRIASTTVGGAEPAGYRSVRISVDVSAPEPLPADATVALTDRDGAPARTLPLEEGHAEVTLHSLKAGTHHFTATFNGTARLEVSGDTFSASVPSKLTPTIDVEGASASPGTAKLSIRVFATAEMKLGGTVTIKDGKKTVKKGLKIVNGKAFWTGKKLKAGKHTFTVAYGGTSHVSAGSVKVGLSVMPKHKPSVSLDGSSPAPGKIKFVVHVSSSGATPTGKVTIKRGSHKVVTLKLKHGAASWTGKASGTHSYKASYAGDSRTATGSDADSVHVLPLKQYSNCTALRRDYPHGVGKVGAHDHVTSGAPVTNFYRSTALYNLQLNRSDQDDDGVACEQH